MAEASTSPSAEYRFSTTEVFIYRDPQSGAITLSEKPQRPSPDEIFAALDAAGADDFTVERDPSLPPEREWL